MSATPSVYSTQWPQQLRAPLAPSSQAIAGLDRARRALLPFVVTDQGASL